MGWHQELLIGFDLETTGTDPRTSRIVTAALIEVRGGKPAGRKEWLADPGVPIPAEAVAVHGISSERAASEGRPADRVADEVARALAGYWDAGVPVVAYNASFDLTLLSAELQRHGLPSLSERLGGREPAPVIDPYIIDRTADRYRKGKRNLTAVCAEYGVVLGDAHNATADALAAARLAVAIADRYPKLGALGPASLHRQQIAWYADWAADFQEFLRAKGDTTAVVEATWPMRALTDRVG
ncbi:3'-5' exonuclease [Streptomyces sp. KLOTTS4A1]|uniref:3'-5' exonuclease n=1 Tax=Streptomyces sp. KLOTTS4A1 TaxID=3390996 RepID=UPI0039F60B1D